MYCKDDKIFKDMYYYAIGYLEDIVEFPDKYSQEDLVGIFNNERFTIRLSYLYALLSEIKLKDEERENIKIKLQAIYE